MIIVGGLMPLTLTLLGLIPNPPRANDGWMTDVAIFFSVCSPDGDSVG